MKFDIGYRIFPQDMKSTTNLRNNNNNISSSLDCNKRCVWDIAKKNGFVQAQGSSSLAFLGPAKPAISELSAPVAN